MKLTKEQLSTIKEIIETHVKGNVDIIIPKMLQKMSTVRVKNTKRNFTIEMLTIKDINNCYEIHLPENDKKILTFTYADHDIDLEYMYDVDSKSCIIIKLPDGKCLISNDIK